MLFFSAATSPWDDSVRPCVSCHVFTLIAIVPHGSHDPLEKQIRDGEEVGRLRAPKSQAGAVDGADAEPKVCVSNSILPPRCYLQMGPDVCCSASLTSCRTQDEFVSERMSKKILEVARLQQREMGDDDDAPSAAAVQSSVSR